MALLLWRLMRTDSSPSRISSSSMPDSSSSSISFLTLRISIDYFRPVRYLGCCRLCGSGTLCLCQLCHGRLQRQAITVRSQPHDHASGDIGEIGVVTECLAPVDVGKMHFDKRNAHAKQCIAQRDAGMGE